MTYYILLVVAAFWATVAVLLNGKRIKEQQRANRNDQLQKFWYGKWMAEMEDHVITNAELQVAWDAYKALDVGTEEIETNYQQELLDEYDKVRTRDEKLHHFTPIVKGHMRHCILPLETNWDQVRYWLEDPASMDDNEPPPIYESVLVDMAG